MAREIKFRAWDTKASMMIQDVSHVQRIGLEVMQYTGLKDKNGVEIYERDILNIGHEPYTSEDDDGNDIEVYESEHVSAVRWSEDGTAFVVNGGAYGFFGGEYDSTTHGWAIYDGEYEYEVIGNLYENPDLLKAAS